LLGLSLDVVDLLAESRIDRSDSKVGEILPHVPQLVLPDRQERALACAMPRRSVDSRSSLSASRALYIASELRRPRSTIWWPLFNNLLAAAAERCSLHGRPSPTRA
jgi:hypothetical protein